MAYISWARRRLQDVSEHLWLQVMPRVSDRSLFRFGSGSVRLNFVPVRFWFSDELKITVLLPVPPSANRFLKRRLHSSKKKYDFSTRRHLHFVLKGNQKRCCENEDSKTTICLISVCDLAFLSQAPFYAY